MMDGLLLLIPFGGLVLNGLVQVLICRSTAGRRISASIAAGFGLHLAGGAAATLAAAGRAATVSDVLAVLAANLIITAGLGYGYFTFVNLNVASVRIRIVKELLVRPEGMTDQRLEALYDPQQLADLRIGRLLGWGQLLRRGEVFTIGRRQLLWAAQLIEALKWAILGHGSRLGAPDDAESGRR